MKLTKHAQTRSQQRGIPSGAMDLIVMFGVQEKAHGGLVKYRMTDKSYVEADGYLKSISQTLERARNRCLIVNIEENIIITGY